MNYGKIITYDVGNGDGIRITLFVSGCKRHCKNCFNKQTWDFNYGKPFTEKTLEFIEKEINKPYINGITILGGEPLEFENREVVSKICKHIKNKYPNKTIWIYTGFIYEDLIKENDKHLNTILKNIDVLVDGPFIDELKNIKLQFRGSSNQRILKLKGGRLLE